MGLSCLTSIECSPTYWDSSASGPVSSVPGLGTYCIGESRKLLPLCLANTLRPVKNVTSKAVRY